MEIHGNKTILDSEIPVTADEYSAIKDGRLSVLFRVGIQGLADYAGSNMVLDENNKYPVTITNMYVTPIHNIHDEDAVKMGFSDAITLRKWITNEGILRLVGDSTPITVIELHPR